MIPAVLLTVGVVGVGQSVMTKQVPFFPGGARHGTSGHGAACWAAPPAVGQPGSSGGTNGYGGGGGGAAGGQSGLRPPCRATAASAYTNGPNPVGAATTDTRTSAGAPSHGVASRSTDCPAAGGGGGGGTLPTVAPAARTDEAGRGDPPVLNPHRCPAHFAES